MMGQPTHINGLQIVAQVLKEPGWWDGIVVRPNAPFANAGRTFVVFRNWDGKSNSWGSGIYDLTFEEARKSLGMFLPGDK